jgi:hypothetical protein
MAKSLKRRAKEIFRKTKSVECPAFPGEKIAFNSKGINHLERRLRFGLNFFPER